MELWGGLECTVNRVGDEFFCQFSRSGHLDRSSDLDLIARLGLRAIRYPVLWDKWAPRSFDEVNWNWADARLGQLRELNIRPIVGLVHHGSGPRHTNLVDDSFAPGLARWAGMVAQRFPWVDAYTPVNEPLTTARFSTLYGFWYPHAQDDRAFVRAIVNQCRATVLAMREIRRVNPTAQLVQTDDMSQVYSTPRLEYQADFENTRRWLTFDLLCGKVVSGHPMHHFLHWYGIPVEELDWFAANPCPPDIIGLNHYATSNRFLDENVDVYPPHVCGSNGRDEYADVEAVRVDLPRNVAVRDLLTEAWKRYERPVAITEVHLGCTREEQMRWLHEVWQQAQEARAQGVPVQAVTAWSLLGALDWNSVVTRASGHYEPGVFDTRAPEPRATALAHMLHALGHGKKFEHPVLSQPGWWRRDERILFETPGVAQAREKMLAEIQQESTSGANEDQSQPQSTVQSPPQVLGDGTENNATGPDTLKNRRAKASGANSDTPRPLLIVGANGTLGRAFTKVCQSRGLLACAMGRFECDIRDASSIRDALDECRPWAVVNTAGYVRVDDAEDDREACFDLNARGAIALARECAQRQIPVVNFSSDLVFDGTLGRPYTEEDKPNPLNVYGASKAEMEEATLSANPKALVVRTSAFFGPWDEWNFPLMALRALERGEEVRAPHDVRISPTYVPSLVDATLDLLLDGTCGLWHGANDGELSWHEWALEAAQRAHISTARLIPVSGTEMGWRAPRPLNSILRSARAWVMPSLSDVLDTFERERVK